ncbi:cellulose binding domain-containing protein [Micromonospora profundi]|uniref:Cellulose binding domain-containing protein n=1 Tax=Micromonospora profundi TaxID=1420889 RepID=A0AAJ6HUF3_9ACTN|nr:cellulose binding domain-containing protein [Micromonospora profundi]WLS44419.1 cellulose binding domain-containing protein [Micromonospora profundi]
MATSTSSADVRARGRLPARSRVPRSGGDPARRRPLAHAPPPPEEAHERPATRPPRPSDTRDHRHDAEAPTGPPVVGGPGRRRGRRRRRPGGHDARQRRIQRRGTRHAARRLDHRRLQRPRRIPHRTLAAVHEWRIPGRLRRLPVQRPGQPRRPRPRGSLRLDDRPDRRQRRQLAAGDDPRTVLLHIGTNDMYGDTSGAPGRLAALVDKITNNAPNADVFVATIVPKSGADNQVRGYNAAIPGIVQTRAAAGKRVHLVDMYRALTLSDLADGVHPNATGYRKMADAWYTALRAVPGSIGGDTPPTTPPPTTAPPTTPPPTTAPPTTPPPSTPSPAGGCQVSYTVNAWNNGLTAAISVTNTGSAPINGWSLAFTLPSGQTITGGWNATYSPTSGAVTARNVSYNGTIAPNTAVDIGFQATHSGNAGRPSAFTLNGAACAVA